MASPSTGLSTSSWSSEKGRRCVSLGRLGALPLAEVAHLLHGLCEVTAAHLHGIVHRDIKPDNILVGTDRRIRLFDFAIAKQPRASDEESLTQANVVLGSLAYMSRQQLLSPRMAAPSFDTGDAAVVAYEALSGTLPFPGKSFSSSSSSCRSDLCHCASSGYLPTSDAGAQRIERPEREVFGRSGMLLLAHELFQLKAEVREPGFEARYR